VGVRGTRYRYCTDPETLVYLRDVIKITLSSLSYLTIVPDFEVLFTIIGLKERDDQDEIK